MLIFSLKEQREEGIVLPLVNRGAAFRGLHAPPNGKFRYTILNRIEQLEALLRERIVILDGAMGTMIQERKLDEAAFRGERFKNWPKDVKGLNDLLNITRPKLIEAIHRQYLEAGADIIETNTFNAQAISLADYRMEGVAYEMSKAGAECARWAAERVMAEQPGRLCLVAGAIGPTTKTTSISTDVNNPAARGARLRSCPKTRHCPAPSGSGR